MGDASGSVDSLTGEGLGLAFQQANALAEALANDDLPRYEVAHRRINRPPEVMSRLLLAMEDRAWLRRRALDALAKEPHLFERLLAAHAGTFSPLTFGFGNFFQVGLEAARQPQLKIPIHGLQLPMTKLNPLAEKSLHPGVCAARPLARIAGSRARSGAGT